MVSDERGQLILVGAVTLALIILGLVLVINTALFTQVVGSEGTTENVKDGGLSSGEIGDGIARIVAEENRRGGGVSDIQTAVDDAFESALRNRSVEGSGAYIAAEFDSETDGALVTQETSDSFAGQQPLEMANTGDIGGFNLTVDFASSSSGILTINVTNDSIDTRKLELDVDTGAGTLELEDADGATCSVEATDDTVRLDLSNGRVYENTTCTFSTFGTLEPDYALQFEDSSAVEGTYSFATDQSLAVLPSLGGSVTTSSAIWAFEYDYVYDGPEVTIDSDGHEVDVYD